MSYSNINEIPEGVRKSLSPEDCEKWMQEYNTLANKFQEGDLEIPIGYVSNEVYFRELAWESVKNCDSSRYAEVVVSTEMIDRQGDVADVDSYIEEGQNFVSEGGLGLSDHSNKPITCVWKVYKGIDSETNLPCVIARLNFFRGRIIYDEAWGRFLSGKTQWSIGSLVTVERECNLDRCFKRLRPQQWFELSNVVRGINPRTYVVDYNVATKGLEGVLELHEDVCPIMQKYENFKSSLMKSTGSKANIIEGGTILIHEGDITKAKEYAESEYPDYDVYPMEKGDCIDEDCILVIPHPIDDSDAMLDSMIALIEDEKEAIEGYNTVMDSLRLGGYVSTKEQVDAVQKIFDEIIHDEEKHIGGVIEAIRVVNPEIGANIADGMSESRKESIKGCPAGQHEHAGVIGCHDVFREHHLDHNTVGTDKLDLTDEDVDITAIKNTPTDELKQLVSRIAKILTRYDGDARQRFLSSTPGKEFVVMFLELKRRGNKAEESNMTEKEAGCKGEAPMVEPVVEQKGADPVAPTEAPAVKEAEKGNPPDVLTSIANIASTLASITSVIDQINVRMMKVEEFMATSTEKKSDITDAILSDVDVAGADVLGGGVGGNAEAGMPASGEKAIVEPDGDENGGVASGGHPEPDGDEPAGIEGAKEEEDESKEEESEEESKEESDEGKESEGGDAEDKKTEEADTKEEGKESDGKEESKEEPKAEDKKSDAKEEPKDDKKPPFDEKKKGEVSEEDVVVLAEKGKVSKAEGKEPVAEVATESVAEAPVAEAKSEAPAVAEKVIVNDIGITPPGGGVDFKSAWLKRQAELKAKGVSMELQTDSTNSLSTVTVTAQSNSPAVKLIQPSNKIGVFDGVVGGKSISSLVEKLGTNPKNFLDSFKRD